jgi:chromosome segregation ATPase
MTLDKKTRSLPRKTLLHELERARANVDHLRTNGSFLEAKVREVEHQRKGLVDHLREVSKEYAALKQHADDLASARARIDARERVSDAELYALAALVHAEHSEMTPARRKLTEQMQLRAILPVATGGSHE